MTDELSGWFWLLAGGLLLLIIAVVSIIKADPAVSTTVPYTLTGISVIILLLSASNIIRLNKRKF
jgi:uncharacterized membrane protein HdeD (DUF308 family)